MSETHAEIRCEASAMALWWDLVREAEAEIEQRLDEDMESYLVFLLMRHLGSVGLGQRVMALDYLSALQADGGRRRHGLQEVGDACLLLSGFFPEQAERRRVPLSYFLNLGRSAYDELAECLRAGMEALYRQLSWGFADLVAVLSAIRRRVPDQAGPSPLLAFELARAPGPWQLQRAEQAFPGAVLIEASMRPC